MEKFLTRLANIEDCKKLSLLKREVWETTYRGIYPDSKIDNYDFSKQEEKFKNIILDNTKTLYVVELNNKLIAYIEFGTPLRPYKDYSQEIGLFYILKDYQNQGLGRNLFNIAYNEIKKNGATNFFISCHKYNLNAKIFYEKMGGTLVDIDEDNENGNCPQVKFHYDIL